MSEPIDQPRPGETLDPILGGRLRLFQAEKGYRFSVDALLLAAFGRAEPDEVVLDLGAGCGVVGLILAQSQPQARVFLLELQADLAERARRNILLNDLAGRVETVQGDLNDPSLFPAQNFDLIVANPPFRPLGAGRLSRSDERSLARHELAADLPAWTEAARRWLKPQGRLAMVYPIWRLPALLVRLESLALGPRRLRLVHARPGGPGRLALVEARFGAGELEVEPPLFIHGQGRDLGQAWSPEMERINRGEF